MYDRIRLKSDRLYLTDEAARKDSTVECFKRRVINIGKARPSGMMITLSSSGSDLLRIISRRQDCGRWQVTHLDMNLPAHLRGHNSSGIQTHEEYALALSRVKHFVSLVTETSGHSRILPTPNCNNNSFIQTAELMIQIQDTGHRILISSHLCRKSYQQRPHHVCWGESTNIKGEDLAFSFYDKAAQRKCGKVTPKNVPCTRIECLVKNPERLAKESVLTGNFYGEPGEVVSTLSMDTAYAIIHRNVSQLTGFDQLISDKSSKGNKVADLLFIGLRGRVHEPHELDLALEEYRRLHEPCQRTFSEVSKALRSMAVCHVANQSYQPLPEDRRHLLWSDIRIHNAEHEFATLCRNLGAPDIPEPQILESWSKSTFIKVKPTSLELAGDNLTPFSPPWRTSTL